MRVRAALSIQREIIVRLKYDVFKEFVRGLLTNSKMGDMRSVRKGFAAYLKSQGLRHDDESVLNWLQENTGEMIGGFILENDDGRIDFLITTGTHAELRQIGMQHVEESDNPQGTPRVRQVNLGQKESQRKPGVAQAGKQRRPSYYD